MSTISKSIFLKGRQCPKRLWYAVMGPAEPPVEPEEVLHDRESDGALVERLAQDLFPEGISIAEPEDEEEVQEQQPNQAERVDLTNQAIADGQTIFQAHLRVDGLLAIADVLEAQGDLWFLWEVKSSTHPSRSGSKPLYDWDLAFQVHVARALGLEVAGAGLLLVRADYERGATEPTAAEVMARVDRTEVVNELQEAVELEIRTQREVLAGHEAPSEWPGPRCKGSRTAENGDRPSTCGHLDGQGRCGSLLPDYWVGTLPNLVKKKAEYVANTRNLPIERLDPQDSELKWTAKQQRVIRAVQAGQPEVQRDDLRSALDQIQWPVAYIDFEFDPGMAIPRFEGSRPYDRVPFQWAMAIHESPESPLGETQQFLWLDTGDPRGAFAERLLDSLPPTGSIVAHHESAEITVLKQLAERLGGEIAERLRALVPRFQDTKKIAESGYYHPDQQGSYSIKKLAPPLTGLGYGDLEIGNGMLAVAQWRQACTPDLDAPTRDGLRRDLEEYCGRDAELMHRILEELRGVSGWPGPQA